MEPEPTKQQGIRFSGHSGAIITLLQKNGKAIVRKCAGRLDQNERLKGQSQKQKDQYAQGIACPAVLTEGYINDLYYFEMEYLIGDSIAHQCVTGVALDGQSFSQFVQKTLTYYRDTTDGEISVSDIIAKIRSIHAAAEKNPILVDLLKPFSECLEVLLDWDWSGIPMSDCHGDLTLENIIRRRTGFALIDFDVVDLRSYFMDIGKLYQDLYGQWCIRKLAIDEASSTAHINAQLFLGRLRNVFNLLLQEFEPAILKNLPALTGLNLARIMPYCTERRTAEYVLRQLRHSLEWTGSTG